MKQFVLPEIATKSWVARRRQLKEKASGRLQKLPKGKLVNYPPPSFSWHPMAGVMQMGQAEAHRTLGHHLGNILSTEAPKLWAAVTVCSANPGITHSKGCHVTWTMLLQWTLAYKTRLLTRTLVVSISPGSCVTYPEWHPRGISHSYAYACKLGIMAWVAKVFYFENSCLEAQLRVITLRPLFQSWIVVCWCYSIC